MRRPGVASTRAVVVEGPARLPTAGLPAPPSFRRSCLSGIPPFGQLALAAAMAGSMRAARNETPERSAIVQGWATSPVTLTG
jgi:hypothetical protein